MRFHLKLSEIRIRGRQNNFISIKWELKKGISLIRETTYRLIECVLPIRLFHVHKNDKIIAWQSLLGSSYFDEASAKVSPRRILSTYFPSQMKGISNSAFIFEILYVLNIKPESAMHKFLFSAVKSFLENPIGYVMLKLFKILKESICSFYLNFDFNDNLLPIISQMRGPVGVELTKCKISISCITIIFIFQIFL